MTEIDMVRAQSLMRFREAMYDKLNTLENVAKSDWRDMSQGEIIDRICDEAEEAYQAEHNIDIAAEAVDIANFAFMLWDNATRAKP